MIALCLLVSALINCALVQIHHGKAEINAKKKVCFSRRDLSCLIVGVCLLIVAAMVETNSIINGA